MRVPHVKAVTRAGDNGCVESCGARKGGLRGSKEIGESSLDGCGVIAAATAKGQISV